MCALFDLQYVTEQTVNRLKFFNTATAYQYDWNIMETNICKTGSLFAL